MIPTRLLDESIIITSSRDYLFHGPGGLTIIGSRIAASHHHHNNIEHMLPGPWNTFPLWAKCQNPRMARLQRMADSAQKHKIVYLISSTFKFRLNMMNLKIFWGLADHTSPMRHPTHSKLNLTIKMATIILLLNLDLLWYLLV